MGRVRRHGRWPLGATVLVMGVAALVPASVAASAAPTLGAALSAPAANTWHVASTLALGADDTAASCAVPTSCWAIESGELIASTDGGETWEPMTSLVPAGVVALNDLTCPDATTCYLAATVDSGLPEILVLQAGVVTAFAVPGTEPLTSISCPDVAHCLITDGTDVSVTHDGGATWSTYALPVIVHSFATLGCVTGTSTCWIVGDNGETPIIERTGDDGVSWQSQTAPAQTDGMYDVECPSQKTCYAVGADFSDRATVIATQDQGHTWTEQSVPVKGYALRSVSCVSKTTCWASGQDPSNAPYVFATTDSGAHWTEQNLPSQTSGGPPYLSCPSAQACVAVSGGVTFATGDGGSSWSEIDVVAAVSAPQSLSCATRRVCVGVSNDAAGRPDALRSTDGGTTWTAHPMPASTGSLWGVDCPSRSVCYAVAEGTPAGHPNASVSRVLSSTNGGATWHQDTLTDRHGVLFTVSCASTTTCMAIGYGSHSAAKLVLTTDSGGTWAPIAPPPGAFYMDGVSCVSVTACVLMTQAGSDPPLVWTTSDLGATYTQHTLPLGNYYDLGCGGLTCVAVGSNGGIGAIATSIDGGVTWEPAVVPPEAQILGRVSCGSATACAATGYDFQGSGPLIVGTTDAGQTWTAFPVTARKEQPIDVACTGAVCVASDVSAYSNPVVLAGRA